MASRSLQDLHPITQVKAKKFLDIAKTRGIDVLVYCTFRPPEEQEVLYMQGRLDEFGINVDELNRRRLVHGLYRVSSKEASRIITNAEPWKSFHQYSFAFDCVPMHGGKAMWRDQETYEQLGQIAKIVDLEWAGSWKHFKETPHFQDTGTYNHIITKQ